MKNLRFKPFLFKYNVILRREKQGHKTFSALYPAPAVCAPLRVAIGAVPAAEAGTGSKHMVFGPRQTGPGAGPIGGSGNRTGLIAANFKGLLSIWPFSEPLQPPKGKDRRKFFPEAAVFCDGV